MKTDEAEGALRTYLGALRLPPNAHARVKLRKRVSHYVDALKGDGCPPERVIVQLKGLVRDSADGGPVERRMDELNRLVVDMVSWCIDRYYLRSLPTRETRPGLQPAKRRWSRSLRRDSTPKE
jgi:hypothetical protein